MILFSSVDTLTALTRWPAQPFYAISLKMNVISLTAETLSFPTMQIQFM